MARRVLVLGGGAAGLAAAWGLVRGAAAGRFAVTVVTAGWRLGGKAASGRNLRRGGRIEEHGLHLLAGTYANTFRVLREVYDVRGPLPGTPLADLDAALVPHHAVSWWDEEQGGMPWTLLLAPNRGRPEEARRVPTPREMLLLLLPWMARFARSVGGGAAGGDGRLPPPLELPRALRRVAAPEGVAPPAGDDPWAVLAHRLEVAAGRVLAASEPVQLALVRAVDAALDRLFLALDTRLDRDPALRRVAAILDLGAAYLRGMIADGVLEEGFGVLDRWDYVGWLRRHGIRDRTLRSPAVRSVHDYVFAYRGGEVGAPDLAAGVGLRVVLRLLLTYRGAIFWRMRAGTGDTVFAPWYAALRRRGVAFRFFRRVARLGLGPGGELDHVDLEVQAGAPRGPYDPLVRVGGVPAFRAHPPGWEGPAGPLADDDPRLAGTGRERLRRGVDFDEVVLALPGGALPGACAELAARLPPWRAMLDGLDTVRTVAAQLWLGVDRAAVGWSGPPPLLTAFTHPLETWADMEQVLGAEGRPEVRAAWCFTGTLPDADRRGAGEVLAGWWPRAREHLFPGLPREAVRERYARINDGPAGRYVLSRAGTVERRLAPGGSGVGGLVLAGDWTRNGLDVGSVEAAVLSGLQAAAVLGGDPGPLVGDRDLP